MPSLARAKTSAESPASRPSAAANITPGLRDPGAKDIAMQLVSAAENSSLDWKSQYGYLEYNVEHDKEENRGYTGGIIGFTSRTHDMLELVQHYETLSPNNPLSPFLPALRTVDGTASRAGLGKRFERAWMSAAKEDATFRAAQDHERDRVYFDPAVDQAQADGLRALGQFMYYDAIVMHGDGQGEGADGNGFRNIRARAIAKAAPPSKGGDEATYLNAFLDARTRAMKAERGHQGTSRVDTLQRKLLDEGNLDLRPPMKFAVYGDVYEIK